jgi:hypothetical protein
MTKQRWERPEVLVAGVLPDALGDCTGGQTEIATGCADGDVTTVATVPLGNHYCNNGGTAAAQQMPSCTTGNQQSQTPSI